MIRTRHLEVFNAIYLVGSITAAARELGVSQPSVSKVLRYAETKLGFRLFETVRGRLVPTDEAHALHRETRDLFENLKSLEQSIRNIRYQGGGHIRLGVVPSLGISIAPDAIEAFRRDHPSVTFDVLTLHHDELFRALYERTCDLAIAYAPPQHPRLRQIKLHDAEMLLMHLGDRQFEAGPVPLEQLEGVDFIGLRKSGPLGDLLEAAMAARSIQVREVVSAQTFYIAAAMVHRGTGMAIVDEFTARATAAGGERLRSLKPRLSFDVTCVHIDDRPLSSLATQFVAQFKTVLLNKTGPI